MESFLRSPQNPFNRDPYFLGGFDQIAHYRGGVKGRAKQFCLEITIPADQSVETPSRRRPTIQTIHKMTFVKGSSPQPELSEYEFSTPHAALHLDLSEKVAARLVIRGEQVLSVTPQHLPPPSLMRKDLSYLRYVFDELSARYERGQDAPQNPTISALFQNYRASIFYVQRRVFASAPVRTQPLRTYTPSEIEPSSEGARCCLSLKSRGHLLVSRGAVDECRLVPIYSAGAWTAS